MVFYSITFFDDLNGLKYEASPTLHNAREYADENAGWVRYKDVEDVINEEAENRNRANAEIGELQQSMLKEMKDMLNGFDLENNHLTWEEPLEELKEIDV